MIKSIIDYLLPYCKYKKYYLELRELDSDLIKYFSHKNIIRMKSKLITRKEMLLGMYRFLNTLLALLVLLVIIAYYLK